jgi:hypothetical protein
MHPSKVPKKKTNKTKTALEEQSKTPTKSPLPTAKKAHHNPPTLDTQLVENTINVRFTGDNAHTHWSHFWSLSAVTAWPVCTLCICIHLAMERNGKKMEETK